MSGGILFGNRLLDVAAISCFSAQFYKVFFPVFKGQKPQWAAKFPRLHGCFPCDGRIFAEGA